MRHDVDAELWHYLVGIAQRRVLACFCDEGADVGEGVVGSDEKGQFFVDYLVDFAVLQELQLLERPPLPQQLRIQ